MHDEPLLRYLGAEATEPKFRATKFLGAPTHLIPIQDAGLQTYLRSLDIRFTNRR